MSKDLTRTPTKATFRQKAEEALRILRTEVKPFADTSEKARKARVERSRTDHFFFFKTYLPHYFKAEEAPFHHELVELLEPRPAGDAEVVTPVAIAAPRFHAKTTITSFGYTVHQICHALRHFIILGSDTEDLASDLTEYLCTDLLENERIKADFGELVSEGGAVSDFVTRNDIRVLARGRGQRMRGLKHKQWRPDLVILDDLENDDNVRNPKQVQKLLKWIRATVIPAIDPCGNLFWVGTVISRRSALGIATRQQEAPYTSWVVRRYQGLKPDGTSLWPALWPVPKLMDLRDKIGSAIFQQEIQNEPRDDEGMFREEWVKPYKPEDLVGKALRVLTGIDPSATSGASSDYKAVITLGFHVESGLIYVLSAYIRRETPDGLARRCYDVHKADRPLLMGIEENMLKEFLWSVFDNLAREKRYHLPLVGVHHLTNKEGRLQKLSAAMERGKILFLRGNTDQDELIEQLLSFPSGTVNDDGPDAMEVAYSLIETCAGLVEHQGTGQRRVTSRLNDFAGSESLHEGLNAA